MTHAPCRVPEQRVAAASVAPGASVIMWRAGTKHFAHQADCFRTYQRTVLQGESLAYVQQQLGHSSIQVAVDIYGHLIPGANRAAVDRLDALPARNPDATGDVTSESANRAK